MNWIDAWARAFSVIVSATLGALVIYAVLRIIFPSNVSKLDMTDISVAGLGLVVGFLLAKHIKERSK